MPRSLGPRQIAECMRCGGKVLASDLLHDGRNQSLLVCGKPGCWDPPHPQERPFVVNDVEGLPRFPVAPEQLPTNVKPVLTLGGEDIPIPLTWTEASTWRYIVDSYRLYRAPGTTGAFALLQTFPVADGEAPLYIRVPVLAHDDATAVDNTTYRYYVAAVTDQGQELVSNVVQVTAEEPAPEGEFRLLEDGFFRLLEDGSFRLFDVPPPPEPDFVILAENMGPVASIASGAGYDSVTEIGVGEVISGDFPTATLIRIAYFTPSGFGATPKWELRVTGVLNADEFVSISVPSISLVLASVDATFNTFIDSSRWIWEAAALPGMEIDTEYEFFVEL